MTFATGTRENKIFSGRFCAQRTEVVSRVVQFDLRECYIFLLISVDFSVQFPRTARSLRLASERTKHDANESEQHAMTFTGRLSRAYGHKFYLL